QPRSGPAQARGVARRLRAAPHERALRRRSATGVPGAGVGRRAPEVLLLDEPTSALDGVSSGVIVEAVREHLVFGGTVVLVSHDLTVVRGIADTVLVFDRGHLIAHGRPDEIDCLEAG